MPLAAGQSLTFYEILGPLGAGGMGEVYRARDTRLEREVAIKVLPEELADDEERLRRFEREAKTLATLNHPNVAGIHGVDQDGDVCFLALELVPGEDLAARLARGPLPVDEAIEVCRQIAEGLEAAHEAGVIHRDLKPANVRLTPDGIVKILDFGLAKPVHPKAGKEGTTTAESDSFLVTEEGLVLGTPTYMSPEQARGRPVDRRTDVWAFGCVLYECLSGERPFRGESLADVLASIVGDEPDWSKLPALPARVDELVRRTLTKDPRERLRDMGEARVQLSLARTDAVSESTATRAGRSSRGIFVGATLLLAGAAVGAGVGRLTGGPEAAAVPTGRAEAEERDLKFVLHTFEEGERFDDLALSPTAEHVAWRNPDGLHVRSLDELEPRTIHPESVDSVAWSPDGQQLAFALEKTIMRVAVDGGPANRVAQHGERVRGLRWIGDELYFISEDDVHSVRADGGTVELRAACGEGISDLHGYVVLPGNAGILAVPHEIGSALAGTISRYEEGRWLPIFTSAEDNIFLRDVRPNGAVLFFRLSDSNLWILPPSTEAAPASRTARPLDLESRSFSLADDGTAVYVESDLDVDAIVQASWFQLDGSSVPIGEPRKRLWMPILSQDGERFLFRSWADGELQIWTHDIDRGIATLFLAIQSGMGLADFLPDGRIVFTKPDGVTEAYAPSGKGDAQPLADMLLRYVSDDGKVWVWSEAGDKDLIWSNDEHCSDPRPLLGAQDYDSFCAISSDGSWMLYTSERTGEAQVYLSRFPPKANEDWPVSASGCRKAWFLDDLSAIVFLDEEEPTGVFRVSLETEPGVRLGIPELLFELDPDAHVSDFDGVDRFLGATSDPPGKRRLVFTTEWRERLR